MSSAATLDTRDAPALSILIVAWNNERTIGRCLESVRQACSEIVHEVLVWDNASADSTIDVAGRILGSTHVTRSPRNLGFAAAVNAAARQARSPYLLLLNPDAYLEASAGHALSRWLHRRGRPAVVGGQLTSPDGVVQLGSARPFPTSWRLALWLLARRRVAPVPPLKMSPVDAVSGALMLVPATLWEALGGFDEGYVHSSEDLDFCLRAARAGAEVWYEPSLSATHELEASVRQTTPEIEVLRWRGLIRFVERREGALGRIVVRRALAAQTALAAASRRCHLRRSSPWGEQRTRLLRAWLATGEVPALPQVGSTNPGAFEEKQVRA